MGCLRKPTIKLQTSEFQQAAGVPSPCLPLLPLQDTDKAPSFLGSCKGKTPLLIVGVPLVDGSAPTRESLST